MALTTDITVLVFTWMKTYSIHRDALHIRAHVPITVLLLRDGRPASSLVSVRH